MEGRREEVLPFLELVGEFGDDGGELVVVEGDAGVARVEHVVNAVEQPAHGDAGEEVEGGLFFLGLGEVRLVFAGEGDGGLDVGDAGLGERGEFGEVVTVSLDDAELSNSKGGHTFLGCSRTRRSDGDILARPGLRRGYGMLTGDGIWWQWR